MKHVINLAMVAAICMTMVSCMSVSFGNANVDKTPTQVTELNKVTALQPFDEVDIANSFKVIYEQGTDHSARIEASEEAIKQMTVYVKDHELRIRSAVKNPTVKFNDVKIYVTSPDIKSIEIAGSGMFAASNKINAANDLDIDIAGSGKVLLAEVTCKDSDIEIAGSGSIEVGNINAMDVHAKIAGSGDINLATMSCNNFHIEIAGSGDVNCDNITAEDVHTEIAGSGNVNLKGLVKNNTKDIAGSGKVNIVNIAPDISE